MNFLIVNGPNLNLLGTREPQIYGNQTFLEYLEVLRTAEDCTIDYVQSNVEGEIINALQASKHDGIILNAGGYTHTSVAIRDCIAAISVPVVEVHISNLAQRESFRHDSLITAVCKGSIMGFGLEGYHLALQSFLNKR
ncbi:MAG: type II 3-dehydroquinate dehydratase [Candidatus Fluviicola riflensis]|nr:MAG: type II 3-dehydroquinate dehydratase [Candidatus Fluviicola riflensis]OGS77168.1 MAG: type II 3-dehydroquinate dehydratase [Candidatus Fluviicola riflensis]OGS82103.1 MAG: type II 3-dehydroquinate dehydratase [Fluviicola sp. RIFCSPHIGHO2_01_FULL_43_53]OGS87797.1 MAG: type II 3-dehydroquinate dehydratase [Fluviicola sp. RIFCSPHIGHO2_12_FULL_43_24]